jgi:predicted ATPase/DNA-binding CsgD family transcriptional regulator
LGRENGSNGNGREETILSYAADGVTDKQIAQRMGLSFGTVDSYWRRIRKKLNASSRTDAVAIWVRKQAQQEVEEIRKTCVAALRAAAERTGDSTLVDDANALESKANPPSKSTRPEPDQSESSWPVPVGRLYGRQKELATIRRLFDPTRSSRRLVTLWGPGGSGKTRLALAAGHSLRKRYKERAWFIPLASLSDPSQVGDTVVQALGIKGELGEPPVRRLKRFLNAIGGPHLLVLDNLEHLVQSESSRTGIEDWVALLLEEIPDLRVLTTSRRPLGILLETTVPVFPLTVPTKTLDKEAILSNPSVRMFLERAVPNDDSQLTDSDLEDAAGICRLVEGIPLAIEIAAARARKIPFGEVRRLMQEPLTVPNRGNGRDPRHLSLDRAVAWSYDLLTTRERKTIRALSVFRGGWTDEAAEAVVGEVGLEKTLKVLADHSLIVLLPEKIARYSMLEVVRQFAEAQASPRELARYRKRHVGYFTDLPWAKLPPEQRAYAPQVFDAKFAASIAREIDNFRAAFAYCHENRWIDEAALLQTRITRNMEYMGLYEEDWANVVRVLSSGKISPGLSLYVNAQAAYQALKSGWLEEGLRYANVGERLAIECRDRIGLFRVLVMKSSLLRLLGKQSEADECAEKLLAMVEENSELGGIEQGQCRQVLEGLAGDCLMYGMFDEAERSLERARSYGGTGSALHDVDSDFYGTMARMKGDFYTALQLYGHARRRAEQASFAATIAIFANQIGLTYLVSGDYALAKESFEETIRINNECGLRTRNIVVSARLAEANVSLGDFGSALEFVKEVETWRIDNVRYRCEVHRALALYWTCTGERNTALFHARKAVRFAYAWRNVAVIAQCLERRAQTQDRFEPPSTCRRCRQKAEELRSQYGLAYWR